VEEIPDGTQYFLSQRAVTMPMEDAYRMLPSDLLDEVLDGKTREIVPVPKEWSGRIDASKPKRPSDVASDYQHTGSAQSFHRFDTAQEAREAADAINQKREIRGKASEPFAYTEPADDGESTDVVIVHFEGPPPEIVFVGDIAALKAMERQETAMQYVKVQAEDSHGLAQHFDADPAVMGDQNVPLVAIEVRFPDDEER